MKPVECFASRAANWCLRQHTRVPCVDIITRCHKYGVVGVETRPRAERFGNRIPKGVRNFPFFRNVWTGSEVHPASYSIGTGVLSWGWRGRGVILAEVKNVWSYTCKTYTYTGLDRSLGLQEVEAPSIPRQSAHEGGNVVSPTHRPPLPPGDIPGTHFCYRLSRPQGPNPAGRIESMKNSSDPVGNRTPTFRLVAPQRPSALYLYSRRAFYKNLPSSS